METQIQSMSADQVAAHDLLSELRTRITTQPLPYQYGVETRALESLREVFDLAREAMKKHPGCEEFGSLATNMLNVDLRPVTAKWHRAYEAGLLDSRDGANAFRIDLAAVQVKLAAFCDKLHEMAYAAERSDELTPNVLTDGELESYFRPVPFGISKECGQFDIAEINNSEAIDIAARRAKYAIEKPGVDAVGLALSGGGIRSATFCLGVIQVLVERNLMIDVDYLSTVSGGGYTGSFVTSRVGCGESFAEIGRPNGPDTASIRHLRQNAKYLSAVDLKQRWLMVTSILAGLLLNWTAPLCVLAIAAFVASLLERRIAIAEWCLHVANIFGVLTAVSIILFGISLRFGVRSRLGGLLLGWGGALTVWSWMLYLVELWYPHFKDIVHTHWTFSSIIAGGVVVAPAIVRFVPIFNSPATQKWILKSALIAAGIVVPALALACFYLLRMMGELAVDQGAPVWSPLRYCDGLTVLALIACVSGAFAMFLLNINLTGPHKFYRDQLAKTFVETDADHSDIPLDGVNSSDGAPYHLMNATLNLPSSVSPVLRDRRGDFFVFAKHWSGAPSVGYFRTSKWKSNGAEVDLATAMAISGAAASPQMGLGSMPTLSALMTLLNVRLGFWIAHPMRQTIGAPGFLCLLREMTGASMSEAKPWLNVSDGGHIENTGVYELLRRRCKFIICIDGEADPESTFHGQMTLVRHAQIDFGVRIEPRLDEMRANPKSKLTRTHSQLFKIHYPSEGPERPAAVGLMLYLKLSLTGDEAELLKRYRTVHPDFPHQSTIDQFYDEEQFEAYRQLGVHVAEGALSSALLTRNRNPANVSDWFQQLAGNMLEPAIA
jgi:hypothetical protein